MCIRDRLDSALGDEVILAPDGFSGIGLILIDGVVHIDFKSGGEDWSFPIDKD